MFRTKFITTLFTLFAVAFFTSCDDDSSNPTDSGMTPTTKIRVIHASYDAPAVDVRVDGDVAIQGLAYGESSGYAEVPVGTRNVTVTPAGATAPVVIDADLTLQEGTEYTVYAVGDLGNIEAILTTDDRAPSATQTKIRFVHAAPDAPAVDIKLNDGNGATVFAGQAFKGTTAYTEVAPGSYTFAVTAASATAEVVIFEPVTVAAGNVLTVVARGTLDNTDNVPFEVRVFVDNNSGDTSLDLAAATANVNVTHASPDAPGVDLLVDGLVVNGSALTFPNSTGYLPVAAGTRNVKVNASGTSTSVIDANLDLDPMMNYSVFAIGELANIAPLVLVDDLTAPASGQAHVRFLHLSPDAPTVDITLDDGSVVFDDRSFNDDNTGAFTPLAAGAYDLQVRSADGSVIVLDLPTITLENGKIYTIFARGFATGASANLNAEIIANN